MIGFLITNLQFLSLCLFAVQISSRGYYYSISEFLTSVFLYGVKLKENILKNVTKCNQNILGSY